ncbi:ATP-dependent helicase OS=Streptomyces tendae OX=1932 GN=GUR47_34515 PE=4 SV=1 [Streptomyces tendae]
MVSSAHRALDGFSPATRDWFTGAFSAPTSAQAGAWQAISQGSDVLVVAPTGSGKTLAAFLAALDQLTSTPPPADPKKRCRVLYVSPLKALAVDVERNLRSPLTGIRQESVRLGLPEPEVKVGIRSGDTPPAERRALSTRPPDILITTPESLFLMLTSATRDALTGIETVILDEVHAVAGTKRGAHLALTLERLDELLPKPARRIGLSATVRPVDEVARFLAPRGKVEIVQPESGKEFDLSVVVPVEDLGELGGSPVADGDEGAERPSIWPHVEERITDLVQSHRSTICLRQLPAAGRAPVHTGAGRRPSLDSRLLAELSARRSCASSWTRRYSPSWSASCSGSPRTAGPRTPRASPTCFGCWVR